MKYLHYQHIFVSLNICYHWYWTITEIISYLFTLQTKGKEHQYVPIGCVNLHFYIHFWRAKSIPLMQHLFCFTELYWIAGCDRCILKVFQKRKLVLFDSQALLRTWEYISN